MFYPEGVYPALLTPFDESFRVNESELRRLVEFCIEKGVDGLFPVSSVGEGLHMDFDKKCRMMNIVVDQARGRVPITPGVIAPNPYESAILAKYAASIGCEAVVATPPYYLKPGKEMVERFFETIVEQSGVPVILYNIPLFTQPLDYDVVTRLTRNELVVGMKDSSGSMVDFLHFMNKIDLEGGKVSLLTGREETLLPSLFMGAKGCMTASTGIFPEIMVGIYKAWKDGDIKRAKELQMKLLPLVRMMMFGAPFPLGFKLALELRGFKMGPPLLPPSEEEVANINSIKPVLEKMIKKAEGSI